jgi:splicing factor 3A subunit 2
MDRQNRVGSKFGGGGVSSAAQTERERKERLKQLALESIDLAKDPYLVRNHLGSYECKLCLTLHRDESNYLAHTQGKKHQQGLARRAHNEKLAAQQQEQQSGTTAPTTRTATVTTRQRPIRIGRPAYQVFKSRDAETNQRCLSFELHYPELDVDRIQPRHRFMSAFEQRVEPPPPPPLSYGSQQQQHHNSAAARKQYQYLLFAAEPYETIAFKIPNEPMDQGPDRFVTHWDTETKRFTLTLHFLESSTAAE